MAEARTGSSDRGQRHDVDIRVLRTTMIVTAVVLATFVGAILVWRLRVIILLILVSLFLAALLNPVVGFVQRHAIRRRGIATAVVFLAATAVALSLGYLLLHPVYDSANKFAAQLPTIVRQAQHGRGQIGRLVTRLGLLKYVQHNAPKLETLIGHLGKPALAVGKTVVGGFVSLVTVAVLTFFLLLEAPRLIGAVLEWMPVEHAERARNILDDVAAAVTGYMLGNFATSVIAGIVVYVTLRLTGVPFATVLAIWVGIVDFLPLIGGLLAGVPTVLIALLHSLTAGIVVLAVFLIYQQIENHILNPVVMSKTVRLNPLWVLLAILVGAELGGIVGSTLGSLVGALLAVPAAGAIQVVARDLWANRVPALAVDEPGDVDIGSPNQEEPVAAEPG